MTDKVKELELELGAAQLKEGHLMAAIEEKDAQIEELEAKLSKTDPSVSEAKLPKTPTKTVEVNGKHYRFIVPSFYVESVKLLSEECIEDEGFVAAMVKEGIVGIIEEVAEETV